MLKTVCLRSTPTLLTTALTGDVSDGTFNLDVLNGLAVEFIFLYGSGGTNCTAYLQTSLDGGSTWIDVICFQATTAAMSRVYNLTNVAITSAATPGDAALTANTAVNGIVGPIWRVKVTTTGTYAGATSLRVWATPK